MEFEDRFVQTSCGPPAGVVRLGSGFRLSEDVVLTARHVLLPLEPNGSTEIAIRGPRDSEWTPADLLWPVRDELGNAPDIALLRLAGTISGLNVTTRPIGLDLSDESQELTLDVSSVGFPAFKRHGGRTHQIDAKLKLLSSLSSEALELNDMDLNAGDLGARSAVDDWGGFSGAPVLSQRRVIGVMAAVQREGRFDFRASRLDRVLADRGFTDLLPKNLPLANATETVETPPVDRFVYLLDRDDQELEFRTAHGRCCPQSTPVEAIRASPLICVLPGIAETRHAPYEFLNRLGEKILPELQWPAASIEFKPLPWPRREQPVAQRLAMLRASLWNALCQGGVAPEAPHDYAALMQERSLVRTFYSQIGETPLKPSSAELLRAWTDFFSEVTVNDPCPPTHVLMLYANEDDVQAWLGNGIPGVELLSPLALCTALDMEEWMAHRLPPIQRPALSPHLGTLRAEFLGEFFMAEFRARVSDLVYARLHG